MKESVQSPDGSSIGFFSEGSLKAVPLAGGNTRTICAAPGGGTGAWSAAGTIVLSRDGLGLFAVPAAGGEVRQITSVDTRAGEIGHLAAAFLPDSQHLLFLADTDTTTHTIWVVGVDRRQA